MQQPLLPNQTATIVCECQDSRLYRLVQNNRSKVGQGTIKLAWLNTERVYFVSLDSFCQNIFPETPFVTIYTQKGVTLLFPHIQEGLCGIFIPASEAAQAFCNNLSSIIQLVPFESAIQIPQFKDTIEFHCKDISANPLDEDKGAVEYIQQGGEALKQGFTWLGTKMAYGINKGGDYINSKIDKSESVQVSSETKQKYQKTKSAISETMDVTSGFMKQMFKPVVDKASELKKDLNNHIDKSNNDTLKQGKMLTVATWDATSNALSGLGGALSNVGDSLGNNTRMVVEKKYGQDVTNTFIGVREVQQEGHLPQVQEVTIVQPPK